jgi:large subunit ribosomal protein L31
MKSGIHPEYHSISVSCACGNSFTTGSTHRGDIRVEICAHCHPLYTGKSKLIDTAGRLERYKARLERTQAHQELSQARQKAKAPKAQEETAPAEA